MITNIITVLKGLGVAIDVAKKINDFLKSIVTKPEQIKKENKDKLVDVKFNTEDCSGFFEYENEKPDTLSCIASGKILDNDQITIAVNLNENESKYTVVFVKKDGENRGIYEECMYPDKNNNGEMHCEQNYFAGETLDYILNDSDVYLDVFGKGVIVKESLEKYGIEPDYSRNLTGTIHPHLGERYGDNVYLQTGWRLANKDLINEMTLAREEEQGKRL